MLTLHCLFMKPEALWSFEESWLKSLSLELIYITQKVPSTEKYFIRFIQVTSDSYITKHTNSIGFFKTTKTELSRVIQVFLNVLIKNRYLASICSIQYDSLTFLYLGSEVLVLSSLALLETKNDVRWLVLFLKHCLTVIYLQLKLNMMNACFFTFSNFHSATSWCNCCNFRNL